MSNTKYSEDDVQQLVQLWNNGVQVKDIALAMERTFHNVRNKIKALQKKGIIRQRDISNRISQEQLEDVAGKYSLPLDTVESITRLFTGGKDNVLANTEKACEAYIAQNGYCYYLSDRVKLTFSGQPSDAVPMNGHQNSLVLVCKAIANTRNTLGHDAFVGVCTYIANKFKED